MADALDIALSAMQKGEFARARDALTPLEANGTAEISHLLALAHARAALGDSAGQSAAIDAALKRDPNDLRALLAKGDHLDAQGDPRAASAFYAAALRYLPQIASMPALLQEGLRRAQASNQRLVTELEAFVRARMSSEGFTPANAPARVAAALDIAFGRKRAYLQQPRHLYVPELPQIQFYDRAQFPWLDAIEAENAAIREELQGVVGAGFSPYVTQAADRPNSSQAGLVDNTDWTALFLMKDGVEQPHAARCPRTMAALQNAPLTRIPKRTPSILFSKMAPSAHIPPHTGMLNARLICHLPLIVPEGCSFRVGNDVRVWQEGKAWVFDDSIEHEAWNRSGQDRYVLLFDIWRPELSETERAGIAALCAAIDAYRGDSQSWNA